MIYKSTVACSTDSHDVKSTTPTGPIGYTSFSRFDSRCPEQSRDASESPLQYLPHTHCDVRQFGNAIHSPCSFIHNLHPGSAIGFVIGHEIASIDIRIMRVRQLRRPHQE